MTEILDPTQTAAEIGESESVIIPNLDILEMSTGVQIRVNSVSKNGLASISERYGRTRPKPPVNFVDAKGRNEVNESDPDYIDNLYIWQTSLAMAVNNYLLLRGTRIEYVPDTVMNHDSDKWHEEMDIIGIDSSNARACYIEWIKMVAAPQNEYEENGQVVRSEIAQLLYGIGRLSGTAQEDVDEAVKNFRR